MLKAEHEKKMREMLKQVSEAQQEASAAKQEVDNLKSESQAQGAEDRATILALQGQVDQLSELWAQAKTEDKATEGTSTVVSTLTGEIQKLQRGT